MHVNKQSPSESQTTEAPNGMRIKADAETMAILYRAAIYKMADSMKVEDLASLDESALRTVIAVRFAFCLSEDEALSLELGDWPPSASYRDGEAVAK